MMHVLIYLMLYLGSALMAYSIFQYVRFSKRIRNHGNWEQEHWLFRIPIVLLILFLAGYLSVTLFGNPDLIIAGILFGGSIFVLIMLLLIQRAADRIQENERLEAKLTAAEEASRAKTVFLSNMSHDIRTPLNAITGYTSLAKGDHVTPEQKDAYIVKIENAGHQLLDIVNDVLEMSRIESGKLELDLHPENLEDCVREASDLVRVQLEEKHIRFTVSCSVTHPWVLLDRNQLSRALMNLLCNAGKFTKADGSVSLTLREISHEADTGHYEIEVTDTGIGMSPEFIEKLFTPFERERTSTVSRIQGTGLGMAITKSIIDLMSGRIDVESQPDKGTRFMISLSLPLVENGGDKTDQKSEQADFTGVSVLLVEDNEINMEIAAAILQQYGFTVDKAENGRIALEKVRNSAPGDYQLVLMDIQMPEMDGYTAAREIRALENRELSAIPIIAMSANAFVEDIHASEEAGMNGHIAKPIDISVMMKTIAEMLHS